MKREMTLVKVMPSRTGETEKGKWVMTDIVLAWDEQQLNGETQAQSMVATVNKFVRPDVAKMYIDTKKKMMLNVCFDVRYYNGRQFNSIRTWLPQELCSETPVKEKEEGRAF